MAATKKGPKRAAIYVRISRDRATEVSMAVQERDGRAYAAMKGWDVIEVYSDRGLSASKEKVVRPAYERLQQDVEAGAVDVVIIWKLDRLGRSVIELARVVERFKAKKVDLVSMNDSIDTSTPGGRFVFTVLSAVAQLESEQISLRVTAAAGQRARNGKPHGGGSRTFGYATDRQTIFEAERDLILAAAARVLDGDTPSAIARDWNAEGIPTPTGKGKWWPAGISRILLSDQVAGVRRIDDQLVPGDWPAIITPDLRDRLAERFSDPYNRSRTWNRSLLNGILFCAHCDRRMSVAWKKRRDGGQSVRYRCRNDANYGGCGKTYVVASPLEEYVRDLVVVAVTDPAFRRAMQTGRRVDDLVALEAEIADIEDRLRELAARYGRRAISTAEWQAARGPLTDELDAKQTELRGSLAGAAPDAPDVPTTVAGLEAWWAEADPADRRALVRAAIERIDVGPPTRPGPFDPARVTVIPRT